MGIVAFAPRFNSEGKRDATGAFQPHARRFLEAHGVAPKHLHLINNRQPAWKRAAAVLEILNSYQTKRGPKVICVAFFCHGWANGMQLGFRTNGTKPNVRDLAVCLTGVAGRGLIVPLYCCSTADSRVKRAPGGDGGFADALRDCLVDAGLDRARVDAHVTVGHTTNNPYVRRFEYADDEHQGGKFLVEPKGPLWKEWKRRLRARGDDTRYAFPFWERDYIIRALSS